MDELKVHPLTLREELLHSFEVRQGRGKWRPVEQKVYYLKKTKRVFRKGKYYRVQKFKKQAKFREVYLESGRTFSSIRIDNSIIFDLARPVSRFKLETLLRYSPYEPSNPVLTFINKVRAWAHKEDLSVGGFPLMPYMVILKKEGGKPDNPLSQISEGEKLEGYYGIQDRYIKKFGFGQVWQGDKESDELNVYVAVWTQTGWREYRNELPRFFVKHVLVNREDLGESELGFNLESKEGRQVLLDYVLENDKLFQRDQGGNLIMAPLGIVGWGYGD